MLYTYKLLIITYNFGRKPISRTYIEIVLLLIHEL